MLFISSDGKSRLIDLETEVVHKTYATTTVGRRGLTYCASLKSVIAHQTRGCSSFFLSNTQQVAQRSFLPETITCSVCTHDGVFLICGSADGNIYVWSTLTGQLYNFIRAHTRCVTDVAISSDQSVVVTVSEDSVCKTWLVAGLVARGGKTPPPRSVFHGHTLAVNACCFMESGYLVVTGSADRTCRIFDSLTGRQHLVITVDDALTSVKSSPGDDLLLLGSASGSLFFVSLHATCLNLGLPTNLPGRDEVVVRRSFEGGHSGAVVFIRFDDSRPECAVVGSEDGAVIWWNVHTKTAQRAAFPRISGGLFAACYVPKDIFAPAAWLCVGLAKHPLDPSAGGYTILPAPASTTGIGASALELRPSCFSDGGAEGEVDDCENSEEPTARAISAGGDVLSAVRSRRQKNDELEYILNQLKQKLRKLTSSF